MKKAAVPKASGKSAVTANAKPPIKKAGAVAPPAGKKFKSLASVQAYSKKKYG